MNLVFCIFQKNMMTLEYKVLPQSSLTMIFSLVYADIHEKNTQVDRLHWNLLTLQYRISNG